VMFLWGFLVDLNTALMIFGGERDVQLLGSHLPPASVVCTV